MAFTNDFEKLCLPGTKRANFTIIFSECVVLEQPSAGVDPGGGGRGVRTPPPSFGGPPNFIKKEKTLCVFARKHCILVL